MTTKPDDGARIQLYKDLEDITSAPLIRSIAIPQLANLIQAREEAAVRAFAEDVKEKIKEQMDMVKIVPHHQSKKTEAELAHTVMVYMHQRPVDEALKERMSDLHPESTNE